MSTGGIDPERALDVAKRTLGEASGLLANGLTRLVRESPPGRLEQVMRTPIRRVVLDGIFWQMAAQLPKTGASAVTSTVLWRVTGRADGEADAYLLILEQGRCRVTRGEDGPDPRITITVEAAELLRIAAGGSDPVRAYLNGRIALQGDIIHAAKLMALWFSPPARRPLSD
jgi:putative sterol carrier protein